MEVVLFREEAELFSERLMKRGTGTSGERSSLCVPVWVRVPFENHCKVGHIFTLLKRNKAL